MAELWGQETDWRAAVTGWDSGWSLSDKEPGIATNDGGETGGMETLGWAGAGFRKTV
ncbi:hypothetical protein AJ79_08176 [Helicocarpus griseus UAMH5409]|uniref:Uncharacterized protein n=1 Tax=Helicocarpus griseus UAMH5409 TaxID=1447875 RepID=A0A2B7WVF9_9EURO|nr:hypothetical protein AJ79_08176 [Helicocarpus griseus UAMH5409]